MRRRQSVRITGLIGLFEGVLGSDSLSLETGAVLAQIAGIETLNPLLQFLVLLVELLSQALGLFLVAFGSAALGRELVDTRLNLGAVLPKLVIIVLR